MTTHVTDLQDRPVAAHQPSAALARILDRLPADISGGFTPEQLVALDGALDQEYRTRHLLNLRVTLFGWAYLVILGGRERRSPTRLAEERKQHPLVTVGNLIFLIGTGLLGVIIGNTLAVMLLSG